MARLPRAVFPGVHVHLGRVTSDGTTDPEPVMPRFAGFAEMLAAGEDAEMPARIRNVFRGHYT